MAHLFAYGSLMCEDIMYSVLGTVPLSDQGILAKFQRFAVQDEVYPGIVPRQGGQVQGRIYFDIPQALWSCLDYFEGDMYVRERHTVLSPEGVPYPAWVYVVRPQYHALLTASSWSFQRFLLEGKRRLLDSWASERKEKKRE